MHLDAAGCSAGSRHQATTATPSLQVKHHEGSFAELRAGGAPAEGPVYVDADAAAAALMAAAPVGVKLYRTDKLVL